jgi:acyl-CoA thioesterase
VVKAKVYRARDTKSFATRRVVLFQELPNGTERSCMEIFADFQAQEPASVLEYSPPTLLPQKTPQESPELRALRDKFVADGKISKKTGDLLDSMFKLMHTFFEQRPCTEGITGQTMAGFGKYLSTNQDHLSITEKFSAEWFRARGKQLAALAFNMDGGLSFLPLMHDHKFLEDVGACSSLDFALRVFTPTLDMNQWHIKERKTIAAEGGRTYSEARLFDERGNLVAIESQQSIMRPLPRTSSKL